MATALPPHNGKRRFLGAAFAIAAVMLILSSTTVGADSGFNHSNHFWNDFSNFFHNPINGHNHNETEFCPPSDYGYGCTPFCPPSDYGYGCTPTPFVPSSCSGTPSVSLDPNPVSLNGNVDVVVTGLSECNNATIFVDNYKGCSPNHVLATFTSGATGGNVILTSAPLSGGYGQNPNGGEYGYWICVGNNPNQATEAILTVTGSNAPPTTTATTTIPNTCSGTPSVSLDPNPVSLNGNVNVVVTGLTDCSGATIYVDNYKGCSSNHVLTTFTSGATGGNVILTSAPLSGGYGQKKKGGDYGYWICVNNNPNQATEGILTVTGSK